MANPKADRPGRQAGASARGTPGLSAGSTTLPPAVHTSIVADQAGGAGAGWLGSTGGAGWSGVGAGVGVG
jgi:hypothetical protein